MEAITQDAGSLLREAYQREDTPRQVTRRIYTVHVPGLRGADGLPCSFKYTLVRGVGGWYLPEADLVCGVARNLGPPGPSRWRRLRQAMKERNVRRIYDDMFHAEMTLDEMVVSEPGKPINKWTWKICSAEKYVWD